MLNFITDFFVAHGGRFAHFLVLLNILESIFSKSKLVEHCFGAAGALPPTPRVATFDFIDPAGARLVTEVVLVNFLLSSFFLSVVTIKLKRVSTMMRRNSRIT